VTLPLDDTPRCKSDCAGQIACYGEITVVSEAAAMHREPGSNPERAKDIAFTAEAEFLLPDIPDSCCCVGPAR